ncbi:helix-turn-helix domain-containing protein [Frankia sp. Cj3]|uniref:helix-turn-helix domain-containing protein n=1 Tax=Frankia sp. Cj3 TaxID=2880976 RepID=UPI001EF5B59E|nr:helix-turn-helix domain-containing protein [Frankia sp. Cj3]
MSSTAVAWALYHAPKVDPTARLILVYLAEHADKDGRGAWPSASTIAEDLEVSIPTVRRHLKALEDGQLIVRGTQELVAHISADRRPVVWDLSLDIRKPPPADRSGLSPVIGRYDLRPITGDTPSDLDGLSPVNERPITGAHHGLSPVIAKPSTEPKAEPPPAPTRLPAPLATLDGGGGSALEVEPDDDPDRIAVDAVLASIAERWGRRPDVIAGHAGRIRGALTAGWPAPALAEHLAADPPAVIKSAARLLGHRLAALPAGPACCDCPGCNRWRRLADADHRRALEAERRAADHAAQAAAVEGAARVADANAAITNALGGELASELTAAALADAGWSSRKIRPLPSVVRGLLADVYARHDHDLEAIRSEAQNLHAARAAS